jgi:hypothetical protein
VVGVGVGVDVGAGVGVGVDVGAWTDDMRLVRLPRNAETELKSELGNVAAVLGLLRDTRAAWRLAGSKDGMFGGE